MNFSPVYGKRRPLWVETVLIHPPPGVQRSHLPAALPPFSKFWTLLTQSGGFAVAGSHDGGIWVDIEDALVDVFIKAYKVTFRIGAAHTAGEEAVAHEEIRGPIDIRRRWRRRLGYGRAK